MHSLFELLSIYLGEVQYMPFFIFKELVDFHLSMLVSEITLIYTAVSEID